jgi:hypothetical protein
VEVLDLEGVQDGGEGVGIELHVDDGTNDGLDDAGCLGFGRIAAGGWRETLECALQRPRRVDVPGAEAEARAGRALADFPWWTEGTATRGRTAAAEKNAFVLFALLNARWERRETAPRVVSMVDERWRERPQKFTPTRRNKCSHVPGSPRGLRDPHHFDLYPAPWTTTLPSSHSTQPALQRSRPVSAPSK